MNDTKRALGEYLEEQVHAWETRPLLRRFYAQWHDLIDQNLAEVDGRSVELGSGIGGFAQGRPEIVATDVEQTPFAEMIADAEALPFDDRTIANLIMLDVFHHLASPARFLAEAVRVLNTGGRIVMIEPYCSPLSTIVYGRFHEEDLDLSVAPLAENPGIRDAPMDANIAQPTLAFYRHWDAVQEQFPELAMVVRRRVPSLAYVFSGGYSRRQLIPDSSYRVFAALETALQPLAPLVAFRCLVVLERR